MDRRNVGAPQLANETGYLKVSILPGLLGLDGAARKIESVCCEPEPVKKLAALPRSY
jgi:hypothetical protein